MTDLKKKNDNPKGSLFALFEKVLFVFCVVILVLRATSSESPVPQSNPIQTIVNDTVFSLCMSGAIGFAFFVWCIVKIFSNRSSFKLSFFGIGLVFLIVGITIAAFYAGNKRYAITCAITITAPILMAVMLTHLLDSNIKIKLLLITIAALGMVATVQSANQFFSENDLLIQQYQDDPDGMLNQLGIEKNSFNHILLEHRLYSKDVRSLFTTGNSAGSFAILASFAAIALLAELLESRKKYPKLTGNRSLAVLILICILFGLLLTHSKGAIAAMLLSGGIFMLLLRSKRQKRDKNIVVAGCLVATVIVVCAAALYGERFGRMPGGNSMLVRGQYWNAAAKIFLAHPLTGVGGGNFASYYPQYKPSSAPETVSDPHCFAMSILTQYGPIALLGFFIIILVPLWQSSPDDKINFKTSPNGNFRNLAAICAAIAAVSLLAIRPLIFPAGTTETVEEKLFILFSLYILPAAGFAVFVAVFLMAMRISSDEYNMQTTYLTSIALSCGILGFIIHNLIDFAIFEPGILTAFFAVLACLIALNKQSQNRTEPAAASPLWLKTGAILAFALTGYAYFNYALIPVVKSTSDIKQVRRPMALGQVQLAHSYLDAAADADLLSSEAPAMNGNLYIQEFYRSDAQKEQLFNKAEQSLFIAAQRNPRDYKIFASLAELYSLYAHLEPGQSDALLNEALDSASEAVRLYPGDAELHLRLAQIAEDLKLEDIALKHYRIAVQIEDGFREQFKLMYPGRKVISRLNEDKYLFAAQRIKDLERHPAGN
jgi:hypothetical protein